jgi:hypothetical protein
MTQSQATPTAPVPPDELVDQVYVEAANRDEYDTIDRYTIAQCFAAWGHAQAMQEREELIKLLTDSANMAESYSAQSSPSYGTVALDQHAKQCRAAAERLGGGDQ